MWAVGDKRATMLDTNPEPVTGITTCARLGQAVRSMRRARGMTQTELSAAAGVSRPQISTIESGRANPTMATVMRLLRSLDCSLTVVPANPEQFSLSAHLAKNRPPQRRHSAS